MARRMRHIAATLLQLVIIVVLALAASAARPSSSAKDAFRLFQRRSLLAATANRTRPVTILDLLESRPNLRTFARRVYDFPDLFLLFSDPNTSITLVSLGLVPFLGLI